MSGQGDGLPAPMLARLIDVSDAIAAATDRLHRDASLHKLDQLASMYGSALEHVRRVRREMVEADSALRSPR